MASMSEEETGIGAKTIPSWAGPLRGRINSPLSVELEVTPSWWTKLACNLSPRAPESFHLLFAQVAAIVLELRPCKRMTVERTKLHVVVHPDRDVSLAKLCEMADGIRDRLEALDISCLLRDRV